MQYAEVEESIRQAAAAADAEARDELMAYAVHRLTQFEDAEAVAADEFSPEASKVFLMACERSTSADAASLDRWLAVIDAGITSDGNLGAEAFWALSALEARREFLHSGGARPVASVAITLLEVIDFNIDGPDLEDYLADPQISSQYNTIQSILSQGD